MDSFRHLFPLFLFFLLVETANAQSKLFSLLPPDSTGVRFKNVVLDDKNINIIDYLYFYNGAGVSIGDVNHDGLPDIFLVSNRFSCKLYLNKGNLKFEDVTVRAGVTGEPGTYKTGVVMVDINNDGWMDIYICRSASENPDLRRNILYINNQDGTFTNRAKEYGVDDDGYGTNGYFNDLDGDGDLDLFVVNHPFNFVETDGIHLTYNKKRELVADKDTSKRGESDRYYENVNGKFVDRTYAAGLRTRAFGLSAILQDFNGDGLTDIYQANDFLEPDFLFINKGNNHFVNEYDQFFRHGAYFSMGTDYADINNDGFSDLIVTDMLPTDNRRRKQLQKPSSYDQFDKQVKYGFGYQYLKNVVQLNNGNGTYSDIGYYTGMAFSDWSWAVLIQDFDNDRLKDVYIANGMPRDIHDLDYVRYKTDSIRKVMIRLKNANDILKLLSIIPTVRVQKAYFKNYGGFNFRKESGESGLEHFAWSFGAAYGDLDGDGDLEMVVNNSNDFAFVYKNNTIEKKLGNSLQIVLEGPPKNTNGIGAKIETETSDGVKTTLVVNPMKGYLSSHDAGQIIGIGKFETAKVRITWPDGASQIFENAESGRKWMAKHSEAVQVPNTSKNTNPLFSDITSKTGLNHTYKENDYIDFKLEPLLPHRFSQLGPCLAVGDLNGDQRDDFFVGGAKDIAASVYFQTSDSGFSTRKQPAFDADKSFEDGAVAIVDFDHDGDNDLIVACGGNDYPKQMNRYPVRLYKNDGAGNFSVVSSGRKFLTSAGSIAVGDINKDGKPEIFVAGRVMPGHYGIVPESFMLQIEGDSLINMADSVLSKAGMITSAVFADVNGDTWPDLVLGGEWMPISIYLNQKGAFSSKPLVIENSSGWWNTVVCSDLDRDGDLDIVGGNLGLNTRYRGNKDYPVTMVVSDFDKNGSTDCMISVYNRDKSFPIALRDNVLDQMPYLRKKFLRYQSYANATITDIFSTEQLAAANRFEATHMVSSVFKNDGNGSFTRIDLPPEAQFFPVNAVVVSDVNNDSIPDLLVAGNDYSTEVETGRNDAGVGLVLQGRKDGYYQSMALNESGYFLPGDVKCTYPIRIGGRSCILAGRNGGQLSVIEYLQPRNTPFRK
ncbi:MAG TPA: VCBS repeat-containing protein [Catalimonadaceae bacterium]|nr:VCBS repeat-containing protein [Catalimonadaceae bacterium]